MLSNRYYEKLILEGRKIGMDMLIDLLILLAWFVGVIIAVAIGIIVIVIILNIVDYIKCVIRRIKSNRDIDYMFKDWVPNKGSFFSRATNTRSYEEIWKEYDIITIKFKHVETGEIVEIDVFDREALDYCMADKKYKLIFDWQRLSPEQGLFLFNLD